MLLCSVMGRLTIRSWALLPVLFLTSAAGIAAALDVLLGHPVIGHETVLSAPLLFGAAAGLMLLADGHVDWRGRWQRYALRFTYPLALVVCAVAVDGLHLPSAAALGFGSVALVLLCRLLASTGNAPCR
ncbi:hypothetical protein [Saccharopolyspora sp. CA-218241]|uniref:hypothetical protein n=1 Tax=Saccharopolyspora sp. CA-218241 TaxID=3240027 RepID=UPI003D99BE24